MNKAPGPDGRLAEMLKEQTLKNFSNQCLHKEEILRELKENVILLFRKDDREDLKNYQSVYLLSQIYKFVMKYVTNRLTHKLGAYQSVEQAGFRKGYSTFDHLLTMRTLIKKTNEYHLGLYVAFIDCEKAYETCPTFNFKIK